MIISVSVNCGAGVACVRSLTHCSCYRGTCGVYNGVRVFKAGPVVSVGVCPTAAPPDKAAVIAFSPSEMLVAATDNYVEAEKFASLAAEKAEYTGVVGFASYHDGTNVVLLHNNRYTAMIASRDNGVAERVYETIADLISAPNVRLSRVVYDLSPYPKEARVIVLAGEPGTTMGGYAEIAPLERVNNVFEYSMQLAAETENTLYYMLYPPGPNVLAGYSNGAEYVAGTLAAIISPLIPYLPKTVRPAVEDAGDELKVSIGTSKVSVHARIHGVTLDETVVSRPVRLEEAFRVIVDYDLDNNAVLYHVSLNIAKPQIIRKLGDVITEILAPHVGREQPVDCSIEGDTITVYFSNTLAVRVSQSAPGSNITVSVCGREQGILMCEPIITVHDKTGSLAPKTLAEAAGFCNTI